MPDDVATPERMTPEQRADIEARLKARTPGEWKMILHTDSQLHEGWWWVTSHTFTTNRMGKGSLPVTHKIDTEADAALIAHAPGDLAQLLAELRAVEAQLAEARRALEDIAAGRLPLGIDAPFSGLQAIATAALAKLAPDRSG